MASAFDELVERLRRVDSGEVLEMTHSATDEGKTRFIPLPGPQTQAYLSAADILLYGGQASGGKTALVVGLAQEHKRSIIFRRESSQTDGIKAFGKEMFGNDGYNGQANEWNWEGGRSLKLAGLQYPDDWNNYAGRERDLICYDEAGEFLNGQVSSLIAWNRGPLGQRARVVLASNPPRSSDGYWLTEWFAPWLDINHPNRAEPGELLWAILEDGMPIWVDEQHGNLLNDIPRETLSFTFIPAALSDNPYRDTREYRAKIDSLPEPLRTQLKYGDFSVSVVDDEWQAIPTAWVREAQQRWRPQPPLEVPQCTLGVDVAQGGADRTVIAPRYDSWFAPLISVPGSETPGGTDVSALVIKHRRNQSKVVIDVGGGWGSDAYAHLKANGVEIDGYMGVKPSKQRDQNRQLEFANVRSQDIWRFREALDPDQPGGSPIALPPSKQLLADLTSWRYDVPSGKITIEPKRLVKKRLKRSTDEGDAVVMCWSSGAKMISHWKQWNDGNRAGGRVKIVTQKPKGKKR